MNKIHISHNAYAHIVVAISLLVIAVICYLYFLNVSVVQVVMRKEADRESIQLKAEIAQLETRYIESRHTIAARMATLDGFNTEVDKIFVTRADGDALVRAN